MHIGWHWFEYILPSYSSALLVSYIIHLVVAMSYHLVSRVIDTAVGVAHIFWSQTQTCLWHVMFSRLRSILWHNISFLLVTFNFILSRSFTSFEGLYPYMLLSVYLISSMYSECWSEHQAATAGLAKHQCHCSWNPSNTLSFRKSLPQDVAWLVRSQCYRVQREIFAELGYKICKGSFWSIRCICSFYVDATQFHVD